MNVRIDKFVDTICEYTSADGVPYRLRCHTPRAGTTPSYYTIQRQIKNRWSVKWKLISVKDAVREWSTIVEKANQNRLIAIGVRSDIKPSVN